MKELQRCSTSLSFRSTSSGHLQQHLWTVLVRYLDAQEHQKNKISKKKAIWKWRASENAYAAILRTRWHQQNSIWQNGHSTETIKIKISYGHNEKCSLQVPIWKTGVQISYTLFMSLRPFYVLIPYSLPMM